MPPARGGKSSSSARGHSHSGSGRSGSSTSGRGSSAPHHHQRGRGRGGSTAHRSDWDDRASTASSSRRPSSSTSHRKTDATSVSSSSSRGGHSGDPSSASLFGYLQQLQPPADVMNPSKHRRPHSASSIPPFFAGDLMDQFSYDMLDFLNGGGGGGGGRGGSRPGGGIVAAGGHGGGARPKQYSPASPLTPKKEGGRTSPAGSSTSTPRRRKEHGLSPIVERVHPLGNNDLMGDRYGFGDPLQCAPKGGGGGKMKQISESRQVKLMHEADEVMESAGLEVAANPIRQGNDFFDDEVKLKRKEQIRASSQFGLLRKNVLTSLEDGSAWKWEVLNAGSYYDGTKVTRPDEMDCMFIPTGISENWLEIDFQDAPPCFCFLKLRDRSESDPKYTALRKFCDVSTMRLSSTKFQKKIFQLFRQGAEATRHAKVQPFSAGVAALPVEYRAFPSLEGKGLNAISVDLVPALHFSEWPRKLTKAFSKLPAKLKEGVRKLGFHVVPKPHGGRESDREFLWRLSFSAAEKEMTKFIDGKYCSNPSGTCRKYVMRMPKRIMEICKGIDNFKTKKLCSNVKGLKNAVTTLKSERNVEIKFFSTFVLRNLVWGIYSEHPDDAHWEKSKRRARLQDTLKQLKEMLVGRLYVSHFFVPELNIMENVPMEEREFLYVIFTIAEKIF